MNSKDGLTGLENAMRNQTIKNPAPTLETYDPELGPPLNANGNPLSPEEIEDIKAKASDLPRHLAKEVERLSQSNTGATSKSINYESGEVFGAENLARLGTQRKTMLEMTRAALERMKRQGQMTRDEWQDRFSGFVGCEALLCELAPDFDFENGQEANLSDYQRAAEVAIWQAANLGDLLRVGEAAPWHKVKAAPHKDAPALRKAIEEEQSRELWRLLARCDEILGATRKWRLSGIDRMEFDEAHPEEYSLREYVAFVEERHRPQSRAKLPKALPHPTFIEARSVCRSLSDGRDGRYWEPLEGVIALLHCAPRATHSIRFEPSMRLLKWWGTQGTNIEALRAELARLDLDDLILFRVLLSAILHTEKARFSASLDDIIKLIGRDGDARKSVMAREKWRAKVWRSIVIFDSLTVTGTRGGMWKEPGAKGTKRGRMDAEALYTCDPLLLISGTRDTEQGTFDGSAPPKTVSLAPGDWLMPFHGNHEILSEFGDVLPLAQIPRGKPSGAWAACAGLMLSQLWREQATHATIERNSRGKESKVEVLKFRAFTRRELLAGKFRSDYDVNAILDDPKSGHRARDYWKAAIKELRTRGIIGHYAELAIEPGADWREEWLNQRLDIRPSGEMLADALKLHKEAQEAKKRGTRKRALSKAPDTKGDG